MKRRTVAVKMGRGEEQADGANFLGIDRKKPQKFNC